MSSQVEIEKKKLAEKHKRILSDLLKQEGNNICADCSAPNPRWASWNLGVFLCIRCGGVHRAMGTHISKVKSISLDNWTPEQIEHFRKLGNIIVNQYFYPNADNKPAIRSDGQLERFIRDKYERRLFINRTARQRDPTTISSIASPSPSSYSTSTFNSASSLETKKIRGMTKLKEMGFTNVKNNLDALVRANYELGGAVRILTGSSPSTSSPAYPKNDPKVKQLVAMGFDDYDRNVIALAECRGDVVASIDYLVANSANPKFGSNNSVRSSQRPDRNSSASISKPPPVPSKYSENKTNKQTSLLDLDMGSLSIQDLKAGPTDSNADSMDVFGDFISAPTGSASPLETPVSASATGIQKPKEETAAAPATDAKSVFDSDFIKSLYASNPTPSSNPSSGPSSNQQNSTQHNTFSPTLGNSSNFTSAQNDFTHNSATTNFSQLNQGFDSSQNGSNSFQSYTSPNIQPALGTGVNTGLNSSSQFDSSFMRGFDLNSSSSFANDMPNSGFSASKPADIISIQTVPTLSNTSHSLSIDQSPWAQPSSSSTKNTSNNFDLMF